jgi:8-oxo-dGTP pyrophosphatase MutT (NUDIX family)
MKQVTLCLLIKNNRESRELLLAMKKKGFGVGKWNGVGGKFNSRKDKNIIETAIRETEEEIGVKAKHLEKVAVLNFYFPYQPKKRRWDQKVHIFFVKDWGGEPVESEEMSPKWFKDNEIPFDRMWPDDKIWLPKVLEGKKLTGDFFFKKGEIIAKHNIKIVEEL